jgi:hypothetical protein
MPFDQLKQFRSSMYTLLGKAKDALFELMDAVLVTRSVYSFVELSGSPVFRRQRSSIYEALQDGNPPREELLMRDRPLPWQKSVTNLTPGRVAH